MPITEKQLTELEQLARAATPWSGPFTENTALCQFHGEKDARFIHVSREAVLTLIARVRHLEKEADWLARKLEKTFQLGFEVWRLIAQKKVDTGDD